MPFIKVCFLVISKIIQKDKWHLLCVFFYKCPEKCVIYFPLKLFKLLQAKYHKASCLLLLTFLKESLFITVFYLHRLKHSKFPKYLY